MTLAQGTKPPAVICLLGTSRCGSTLLQAGLASYSGVIALGELARMRELLDKGAKCACGAKLDSCSFWAPALSPLNCVDPPGSWSKTSWRQRGAFLRGVLAAVANVRMLAAQAERNSAFALGEALGILGKQSGRAVFIDSSKEPLQFLRLALLRSWRVIPVHIVRDPRGVSWSAFRRTGIDPLTMASHWARLNRALAGLARFTPAYHWQLVRYEDLCGNLEAVSQNLLAIAGFGGVARAAPVNHALGGSPGFCFHNSTAMADERWRLEMPRALQVRVMQVVGGAAEQFGYAACGSRFDSSC